jgi:transcriptional regulator GlxA family with amidase domain
VLADVSRRWLSGRTTALTLDDIAAAASVSVGQLNRTFHSEVGFTPVATIELLRLARRSDSSHGAR